LIRQHIENEIIDMRRLLESHMRIEAALFAYRRSCADAGPAQRGQNEQDNSQVYHWQCEGDLILIPGRGQKTQELSFENVLPIAFKNHQFCSGRMSQCGTIDCLNAHRSLQQASSN
jgi:hypothetical protein